MNWNLLFLKSSTQSNIVGVIYRHPSKDLTDFNYNYLNKLSENISKEQKSIFLLGDFNPIQDGGKKTPSTSFFPVTSTNVVISPKNFLTFSYNPFITLV